MKIYLIRHGMTEGNTKKRYIGTTDEHLCDRGVCELESKRKWYAFRPDMLLVSPLLRCRQTADILFPGVEQQIVEGLRECDFGDFENKNYQELSGNADYQKWVDNGGKIPFPGGEDPAAFQNRCVQAFLETEKKLQTSLRPDDCAVFVIHGGTIMSIMDRVGIPKKTYFDYMLGNGEGYLLTGGDGQYHYQKIDGKIEER